MADRKDDMNSHSRSSFLSRETAPCSNSCVEKLCLTPFFGPYTAVLCLLLAVLRGTIPYRWRCLGFSTFLVPGGRPPPPASMLV